MEAKFFSFWATYHLRREKNKIKNNERLKRNDLTGLILFFNSAQCVYDVRLGQSQIQCCSFFFSSLSILARLFSISLRPISSVLLAVTTTLLSSALYFFPDIRFSFLLLLSALETSATTDWSIYKGCLYNNGWLSLLFNILRTWTCEFLFAFLSCFVFAV